MDIFAVTLQGKNEFVENRITQLAVPHYKISGTCFLIATDAHMSDDIAVLIGLKGNHRVDGSAGGVFKLNGAYSGHASRSLWEWLQKYE